MARFESRDWKGSAGLSEPVVQNVGDVQENRNAIPAVQATSRRWTFRWKIFAYRALVLVVFLVGWQYLPTVKAVRHSIPWLDPFFISSPGGVYHEVVGLIFGNKTVGIPLVWPYLGNTVEATLIGTVVGVLIGLFLGALLSNSDTLSDVFMPYITAINAIPRIALIPVIVLIVGATLSAAIVSCVLVVVFLAFFNAFEGGRSVPTPLVQNVELLGGSPRQVMLYVRLPQVFLWTFAALPNAIAFGLLTVVTTEVLTGSKGMGAFIVTATTTVNSALAFAVVVILCAVGLILILCAERAKRFLLRWA